MLETAQPTKLWWGKLRPQLGTVTHWQIGPSRLWVTRYLQEWRIAHHQSDNPFASEMVVESGVPTESIDPAAQVYRFGFKKTSEILRLMPALADRAVVVKPEHPFRVSGGEEITMYVTTSLWIRLETGEKADLLHELPSYRPSDTWFGANTREGEVCYASRTLGRLRIEDLDFHPHRAITALRLQNQASDPLLLDRVKLPVQYLSLYANKDNTFWTQAATLVRGQDGDLAELQLAKASPKEAGQVKKVADSRLKPGRNLVVRAFSKLFAEF